MQTKRNCRRATFLTDSSQNKTKKIGHSKCNKTAVSAVVTCGMIRDHPDILRLVGLFCGGLTNFCMEAERDMDDDIMLGERKMLCWATKQKVSDSLFPIQSRGRAQPRGTTSHTQGLLIV